MHNKPWKRVLTLICAVCLVLTAVAGCGKVEETAVSSELQVSVAPVKPTQTSAPAPADSTLEASSQEPEAPEEVAYLAFCS